jgi:hypothetical protein
MTSRKLSSGSKTFMLPLLWVVLLIATYWVLSDWESLPNVLASVKAGFLHWSV